MILFGEKIRFIFYNKFIFVLAIMLMLLIGCRPDEEVFVPKPKGYFRIDLPEKKYKLFDSICPYSFRYPVYSYMVADTALKNEEFWVNMIFPQFNGKIHFSYKKVNNNLQQYVEDSRTFVNKHIQKATKIEQKVINNSERKVYGLEYLITGTKSASTIQFYVTDSTKHFVRGALYFSFIPNNDSLEPVIDFVREDVDTILSSFSWK